MSTELAQAIVEGYCGCRFTLEDVSDERIIGHGGYLVVSKRPIVEVASVVDETGKAIADYVVYAGSGLICSSAIEEDQEYFVSYTAGYDGVPADVQLAINALAERLEVAVSGVKSEKLGDYSYDLGSGQQAIAQLPEMFRVILDRYKKIPDAGIR